MAKKDPHNSERCYRKWRHQRGGPFDELTDQNAEFLRTYLDDMEVGANVSPSSKKGPRSYIRLRNLKTKIHSWAIILQNELKVSYIPDMIGKERELLILIKRMRDGEIKGRSRGSIPIRAPGTYVKAFKSLWHWYQRIERRKGNTIPDITMDLDGRDEKPKFNYLTIEQLNILCNEALYDHRVLMMFLFDSGVRAPTELMNIRASDLEWNEKEKCYTLTIRNEVSKTFGRRIKLLLCSQILKEYIAYKRYKDNDYIFTKMPHHVNEYMKKLAHKVLGIGKYEDKKKLKNRYYYRITNGLTMYDFRHSSACYWLPRYKSESALKYRFGWKKSEMIHYYTELLGMKDTIKGEDLYLDVSKTELERHIDDKGKEITLLKEQIKSQDAKMEKMMRILEGMKKDRFYESQNGITSSEFSI